MPTKHLLICFLPMVNQAARPVAVGAGDDLPIYG